MNQDQRGGTGPSQDPRENDPSGHPMDDVQQERVEERTRRQKEHGLDKCPQCGSSDIGYDVEQASLVCAFCRRAFNEPNAEETFGFTSPILELRGTVYGAGSEEIQEDQDVITLKCQGCGADVVIKLDEQLQARCHWCRQTLSVNTQVPNGAVPDAILPFTVTKEQAITKVEEFVKGRRTFAKGSFLEEFRPENVLGVFMPYLMVDANIHAELAGVGEDTVREYTVTVGSGDNRRQETRYDVDSHQVGRKFDLLVNDLTTQSSRRYHAGNNDTATNYILRAIQPFDVAEALIYNPNYLGGFTSERRDLDVEDVDDSVTQNFLAIARARVRPTLDTYDRGVRWEAEGVAVRGTRWVAVLLPVWLYSQYEGGVAHYVAVNGRTGQTMGSVPISQPKAIGASCAVAAVVSVLAVVAGFAALFT